MFQRTSIEGFLGRTGVAFTVFILAAFLGPQPAAAATCDSLLTLKLPDTTVTSAETVAAGAFTAPGGRGGGGGGRGPSPYADLPAFCRVALTLKPSADSDIKVEVWLPMTNWNNKFQAVGNGGWAGSISYAAMAEALRRGYATSSTDTGHTGPSASFAMGHPEKVIDFGWRSEHEMTVKAKAVINAFYGSSPKYSYFTGCSGGGRQGLMEAQRFPQDYDGIVAGAPAVNFTGRAVQAIWLAQASHMNEANYIPPAKYPAIQNAILGACDALDGVKDGVLENPRACKFDPKVLECKGADADTCLTAAQVETARKIYAPVLNSRTKREIFPGLEPTASFGTLAGAQPFGIATDLFRYVVFQDPNWDYKTLNFDSHMDLTAKLAGAHIDALDSNLKPFFDRGGKIIQYHGWSDPQIAAGSSVNYYKSVVDRLGADAVMRSHRLFMVPGMAHCGGGDGTSTFDMLTALEEWVEKGKAPDQIIASRVVSGKVERTRPLCPYPQVATYKGSGSTDDAANFTCKAP